MDNILELISGYLTADYIALISVIITVILFVLSKRSELKYKKHEDKKTQYIKLIKLMEDTFIKYNSDKKKIKKDKKVLIDEDMQSKFFDAGSSLLLYGSKKLYKNYLFFREYSTNPLVKNSKYYKSELIIYIMADILTTMRKEVGLSSFNNIPSYEALGYFVNDICSNPISKINAHDAKYRIKMMKIELAMIDMITFVGIKSIYYKLIKPIGGISTITFKYLILVPFGKLLSNKLTKNNIEA